MPRASKSMENWFSKAVLEISEHIECFYNRARIRSVLDNLSPEEFEAEHVEGVPRRQRRGVNGIGIDSNSAQIGRAHLLVIDELEFLPLDPVSTRMLFQVFADAYEKQSMVITSSLQLSRWGAAFGKDQVAADIDRIVHHGRLIQFCGESHHVKRPLMQEG